METETVVAKGTVAKGTVALHIIQLMDGCYFLYVGSVDKSEEDTMQDCTLLHDFARIHAPIQIMETHLFDDFIDVDASTKRLMKTFGIENVRGGIGPYSSLELDRHALHTLKDEFSTPDQDFFLNMQEETLADIRNTPYSKEEEDQFLATKAEYESLKFLPGVPDHVVARYWISELEWVRGFITKKAHELVNHKPVDSPSKSEKVRYSELRRWVKYVAKKYSVIKPDIDIDVFVSSPEFVFDALFYHGLFTHFESALVTCDTLLMYAYTLINRIDELAFDLESYPVDVERRMYIKRMIANEESTTIPQQM